MYNTVPDLESEEQPLVAAPPRKYGKAMLAVVAALAFGAGALAPSAAARVSQMKLFDIVDPSNQNAVAASAIDCKGGEADSANCGKDKTIQPPGADPIIPIGGTPSEGVTTETETETETETPQFQINTKGGVGAANAKPCKGGETDSSHCSGKTIEATQNGPDLGV
jgi:hypothetical protein